MQITEIGVSTWRIESLVGNRNLYQYVIADQDQAIIIDAGMASTARDVIIPSIRRLGLADRAITAILVTHCDLDHQGGLAVLKQTFPGAIATCGFHDRATVSEPELLLTDRYGAYESEHGLGFSHEEKAWMRDEYGAPTEVQLTFDGGERMWIGERELSVLHAAGHSAGHVMVHEPGRALLFASDAIHGRVCPAVDGAPALPPTYEDVSAYLATIELAESLAIDGLHSGHWPARTGAEIGGFLRESRDFVAAVDAALLERLESPATLRECCDHVEDRLGPFGADPINLMFAVHGHIEGLLRSATIVSSGWATPPVYRRAVSD